MAFNAATVFEIRSAGAELNGGMFNAAAAGTDYSQQNSPQLTINDAVQATGGQVITSVSGLFTSPLIGNGACIYGGTRTGSIDTADIVANGTNIVTSATANWLATVTSAGGMIRLDGGTGSLAQQWYHVIAFNNAGSIRVDRNVPAGTGINSFHARWVQVTTVNSATSINVDNNIGMSGTGMTINFGGAINNIQNVIQMMVNSNVAYIKGDATYQTFNGFSTDQGYIAPSTTIPPYRLKGYGTTRGDSGRATIQLITNTGLSGFTFTTSGWSIENLVIDCNTLATSVGITAVSGVIYNCRIINWRKSGIINTGTIGLAVIGNEITGGIAASQAAILGAGTGFTALDNYIHDNAFSGVSEGIYAPGASSSVCRNIIVNNSGASTDGIYIVGSVIYGYQCIGNICYNNGRHGIYISPTSPLTIDYVRDNILSNNGGYGVVFSATAGQRACAWYDGNVYYNNTSGTRNNGDDTTVNKQNGQGPYTNVYDVVLSGSPFVDAANGDYRLNNNQYGSACKGSCPPKSWPGLSGNQASVDMGPIGHQDAGFAG